ncbi:phosphatidate cytidylyltransferase [Mesorhizobium sp. SP-1A]|uniref:phosphatidate cytidylyltransferase n=1 Tax=Mesorhizobium sp. SP-1A TaxID=3077840 RepID=UPI0028F6E8BE|nr:phosphatidate cytidylyltransferase [Mesorhizobium sp. SP-1A]
MSNLQLRILSALVLAAVVLALAFVGGWPFRLLSALISAAIFFEWTRMTRPHAGFGAFDLLTDLSMAIFVIALAAGLSARILLILLAVLVALCAVAAITRGAGRWAASGIAYAGLSGFSLAFLRDGDRSGLLAILFLFAVVWATDILAYFVGRAVGGPRLAPSISPGKTRSGALGGAVGGLLAGLAVVVATGAGDVVLLGFVALLLSVVAQAGDLFESWVKRRHGCKDSSALIPGHGGVMDRVDGLVAAALALYVIGSITASVETPAQGLFPG